MSYVLSVIHPPVAPAAYGKAEVFAKPLPLQSAASNATLFLLNQRGTSNSECVEFGKLLLRADTGAGAAHRPSGFIFRIDPADNAPHPCPCCGRLVLPTDHADAGMEDAYCLGCFTWSRDKIQCLPANTAHTEEP